MSDEDEKRISQEIVRSVRSLHKYGVAHTDVRHANVLWCEETGRPMVIDFERAVLTEPPRQHLAPIVLSKRTWNRERVDGDEAVDRPNVRLSNELWNEDILAARMVFRS